MSVMQPGWDLIGETRSIWVLQWTDTGERERGRLEQTPEALDSWLSQLMSRLNGRTSEEAAAWADQVRSAVPAVRDVALLDSYILEVTALVALLKQLQTSIKQFDKAIAAISRQHPCWEIAQSLPGAGPVMAPRLLAAMENGKRYRNAHEMQCALLALRL
jgi:hypothetical protein